MEEQLIKCLNAFAKEIIIGFRFGEDAEDIVDNFMEKAELALRPHARQELINYISKLITQ